MKLTQYIKNRFRFIMLTLRSGGMFILLRHIMAIYWSKGKWLWISLHEKGEFIERPICGNKMYLKRRDTGISRELAVWGIHEPLTTSLLNLQIKPSMRVVDIGSNIGYYALQEARLVGETGGVIAIEPVADNVALLKKNIAANGFDNIRIYPFAIGNKNGLATLYSSNESNLGSIIPREEIHRSTVQVPMWTLDTLLADEKKIDLIRMDVEGYEIEAIEGMLGVLHKHKPDLIIEIHPFIVGNKATRRFLERLMQLEYQAKYVVSRTVDHKFIRHGRKYIRSISLNQLILDKQIAQGTDALMIFLKAGLTRSRDPK